MSSHPIRSVLLLFDDIEGGINNNSFEFPSKEWVLCIPEIFSDR